MLTTIEDTLTYADGRRVTGRVVVNWPSFQQNGTSVAGGMQIFEIIDGLFHVELYSNVNTRPLGTYYTAVFELEEGALYTEYWVVPNQPTVSLGQVRIGFPITPSALISASQLTSAGATYGQFLGWDGTHWVPMYTTMDNVTPNTIALDLTALLAPDLTVVGSPARLGQSMTLNIPDAGPTSRGVVTTGDQTFAGKKTFQGQASFPGGINVSGPMVGVQTPWLSNINGGGFNLTNTSMLLVQNAGIPGGIEIGGAAGGAWIWMYDNAALLFAVNNAASMQLNADGTAYFVSNLGIGKFAPLYKLDVAGDCNLTGGTYRINGVPISTSQTPWLSDIEAAEHSLNNANVVNANRFVVRNRGGPDPAYSSVIEGFDVNLFIKSQGVATANLQLMSQGTVIFNTGSAFTEAMRITALGDVGIGNDGTPNWPDSGGYGRVNLIVGPAVPGNGHAGMLTLMGDAWNANHYIIFTDPAIPGAEKMFAYICAWRNEETPTRTGWMQLVVYNNGVGHSINLSQAGNVGIDIGQPVYKLDVKGDCNLSAGSVYRVGGVPIVGGVSTVFGRAGAVVAQTGDYSVAQVTGAVPDTRRIIVGAGLTGGGALNTDVNIAVVNDSSTQRIGFLRNATLVATRPAVNFIQGANTTLTVADNGANNRVDVTITAVASGGATPSNYQVNNTLVGIRPTLNLIAGTNVTLTGVDDGTNDRVSITIVAAGGAAGSQTPWVTDIDAAGHALSQVGTVVQANPSGTAGKQMQFSAFGNDWTFQNTAAGRIFLMIDGQERIVIRTDSVYVPSGNVGIGVSSPQLKLDVAGTVQIQNTTTGGAFALLLKTTDSANPNSAIRWLNGSDVALSAIGSFYSVGDPGNLEFMTGGVAGVNMRMIIRSDGKVGIGTPSPGRNLDVAASTGITIARILSTSPGTQANLTLEGPLGQVENIIGDFYITNDSPTGVMFFRTNGTIRALIRSDGYVGINNPNPDYRLDVGGDCNITGTYRINGTPITAAMQTPWVQDIDAAGFRLTKAGGLEVRQVPVNSPPVAGQLKGPFYLATTDGAWGLQIGLYDSGTAWLQTQWANGPTPVYNLALCPLGGNVGIGTSNPQTQLWVNGLGSSPADTHTGVFVVGFNHGTALEFGSEVGLPYALWIQGRSAGATANRYPIALNPNGGNVGIGTSAPSYRLDVAGAAIFRGDGSDVAVYIPDSLAFRGQDRWYIDAIGWMQFRTGPTLQYTMRLEAGKVGIAIAAGTAPSYTLDVGGDCNITGLYRINGVPISTSQTPWTQNVDANNFALRNAQWVEVNTGLDLMGMGGADPAVNFKHANSLRWIVRSSGAEGTGNAGSNFEVHCYNDSGAYLNSPLFIQRSTGNVGIGTSSPQYKLDVTGNFRASGKGNLIGSASGVLYAKADANILLYDNGGGNWAGVGVDVDGTMWFKTGLVSAAVGRLAINADGHLYYGSDTKPNYFHLGPDGKLGVDGTSWFSGKVGIGTLASTYMLEIGGDCNLSAGSVYRINGVPITTGGSQTPWTSDIDGNSKTLFSAGKIGVGVAAPRYPLSVVANPSTVATATQIGIGEVSNSTTHYMALGYYLDGGTKWKGVIQVNEGTGLNMLLLNPLGGNVAIGTDAPSLPLHLRRDVAANPASSGLTQAGGLVRFQAFNLGLDFGVYPNGNQWIQAYGSYSTDLSNAQDLIIQPNFGKLGIGAVPGCKVDIGGGQLRVQGTGAPPAGAGLELAYQSSTGVISAVDRGSGAYKPLHLNANIVFLNPSLPTSSTTGYNIIRTPNNIPDATAVSSQMPNNSIVFFLDEAGGVVRVWAKRTDGSIKVGAITIA